MPCSTTSPFRSVRCTAAGLLVLALSLSTAQAMTDEQAFIQAGVELVFKDYWGYPEYSQFHHPFDHYVTVLDLLFHVGPDAPYYIWGWRESEVKGE